MLLISHIYTAVRLKSVANPKSESVYYTASILPDIRYTASIPREKTHINLNHAKNIFKKDSDNYKGYYLHLLIDEYMGKWDFLGKLKDEYPKIVQKMLKTPLLNVIIEIYCLEKIKKLPKIILNKSYDSAYKKLGINQKDFDDYLLSIQAILDDYSIESMENVLLHDEKFKNIKKVQLYRKIGKFIINNGPIKTYLISKIGGVYDLFITDLNAQYL